MGPAVQTCYRLDRHTKMPEHVAAARPGAYEDGRTASADCLMADAAPCQEQRPCPSRLAAARRLPWPRCQGCQLSGSRLLGCGANLRDQCGYCLLNSARPKLSAAGVHPALTEVVFPIPRLPQLPPDPRNVLASGPKEAHSLQRSAGSCYSCWH